MNVNSESLDTRGNMSMAEYHAASWEAYERQSEPPDPASLSDHTLHAFLHYEEADLLLPSAARNAVEAESLRRSSPATGDDVTALVMVAALSASGLIIGLGLLVP
jgi:hypothetical protein